MKRRLMSRGVAVDSPGWRQQKAGVAQAVEPCVSSLRIKAPMVVTEGTRGSAGSLDVVAYVAPATSGAHRRLS